VEFYTTFVPKGSRVVATLGFRNKRGGQNNFIALIIYVYIFNKVDINNEGNFVVLS